MQVDIFKTQQAIKIIAEMFVNAMAVFQSQLRLNYFGR